mmetsp:Transcript_427/g.1450  ORF Transcript_427/g.1450 Transcript_427/m.1450 type:complete len:204 (-) Transcript_427:58-669(-)
MAARRIRWSERSIAARWARTQRLRGSSARRLDDGRVHDRLRNMSQSVEPRRELDDLLLALRLHVRRDLSPLQLAGEVRSLLGLEVCERRQLLPVELEARLLLRRLLLRRLLLLLLQPPHDDCFKVVHGVVVVRAFVLRSGGVAARRASVRGPALEALLERASLLGSLRARAASQGRPRGGLASRARHGDGEAGARRVVSTTLP